MNQYPGSVWDGTTPTRDDSDDEAPQSQDWEQLISESRAVQLALDASVKLEIPANDDLIPGMAAALDAAELIFGHNETAPQIVGLVKSISEGDAVIVVKGPLELTAAQWEAALDEETAALVANTEYYLGVDGFLTATRPAQVVANNYVVSVGTALSTIVMNVDVKHIERITGTG